MVTVSLTTIAPKPSMYSIIDKWGIIVLRSWSIELNIFVSILRVFNFNSDLKI